MTSSHTLDLTLRTASSFMYLCFLPSAVTKTVETPGRDCLWMCWVNRMRSAAWPSDSPVWLPVYVAVLCTCLEAVTQQIHCTMRLLDFTVCYDSIYDILLCFGSGLPDENTMGLRLSDVALNWRKRYKFYT